MVPKWILPVAVGVLLVTAGCAELSPGSPEPSTTGVDPTGDGTTDGPATTETGEATPSESSEPNTTGTGAAGVDGTATPSDRSGTVSVKNGELPLNATLVFRRVERLLGVDADTPEEVRLRTPATIRFTPSEQPFERRMGLEAPGDESFRGDVGGRAFDDAVVLTLWNTTVEEAPRGELELVLVHEFVHVVQLQREARRDREFGAGLPRQVQRSLVEGGAVYVTDVYAREYGVTYGDGRTPIDHRAKDYRERPPTSVAGTGPYYFGGRYFDRRLDDPADLWAAYEDPPETMAEVIHGPGIDPTAPLSVDVDAPDREYERRGTLGEGVLRAMFRSELDGDVAATAAAGWSNDTLVRFEGDRLDFAWVLRWTDADEADAFENAMAELADRRSEDVYGGFETVRVAPETVVVLTGTDPFLGNATASGTNGTVTVTVDGSG